MFTKFERVAVPVGRKKLHCNACRRSTIHTLEARCTGTWEETFSGGHSAAGGTYFSLYRCGACDEVCFETSSWDDQEVEPDEDGDFYVVHHEKQYPPPASADFIFNTEHTPLKLTGLLDEMLYALAGAKYHLATVALRMIIEFIVNDRECAGETLEPKINDLFRQGHIDGQQKKILHKIRDKGNAGAHAAKAMTKREMIAGMSVVDLLLEKFYNQPERSRAAMERAEEAFSKAQ